MTSENRQRSTAGGVTYGFVPIPDPHASYQALLARDARFDGRVFIAVKTTGVYCRPVCPAAPAKFRNCAFFPSAAAAQEAGFRPCLRCRPETTYELGAWRGTSSTIARALAMISEGTLDGDEASVDELAERLGLGERQLRRLFQTHVGASPSAVARTRRVLFAKQLLHETSLPMTEVALASGFGSIRQFNDTFRTLFRRSPSAIRQDVHLGSAADAGVVVRLRYRPPYAWREVLEHLRARAIPGVEQVSEDAYARTILRRGRLGTIQISHDAPQSCLVAAIRVPELGDLSAVVARVRALFDLDADVGTIEAHLARDPLLAPLVGRRSGLRVVGCWDGFELAVRAVLGQQVSVAAARVLAEELVGLCSESRGKGALSRAFPLPEQVLGANLAKLGMPAARKSALRALARAALENPRLFDARPSVEETVSALRSVEGVGEWTANYIALRAAREPDAFPAEDAALIRSLAAHDARVTPARLRERAERWRPWRGYAAQHLWAADAGRSARKGKRT